MEQLLAKPKKQVGRPAKYLNPNKAYEWFDEFAYLEAVKQKQKWVEKYEETKTTTGTEYKTLQEFNKALRDELPDLAKLDIEQLYIIKGYDKPTIEEAFAELGRISCAGTDKDTYTIKIPAEKANEYSWYLSICDAFNQIRSAGYTQVNVALLPNICANKIVLNNRSMKLEPNHYLFTKGNERA